MLINGCSTNQAFFNQFPYCLAYFKNMFKQLDAGYDFPSNFFLFNIRTNSGLITGFVFQSMFIFPHILQSGYSINYVLALFSINVLHLFFLIGKCVSNQSRAGFIFQSNLLLFKACQNGFQNNYVLAVFFIQYACCLFFGMDSQTIKCFRTITLLFKICPKRSSNN